MGNEIFGEIICPYCNKTITLDKALTHTLEEKIRAQLEVDAVRKASQSFEKEKKELEEQLQEKEELLRKTQDEERKLRKEQRKLEEEKNNLDLEIERKLDEERKKISEEATKRALIDHKLKDLEKDKQLKEMKEQIDELKRKAEQGSMKTQGEVLELELEQILKDNFRFDQIEPIASGVHGADILHKVCSKSGQICGTILLESKNAKNWSNNWIPKLREDQRQQKADIAVLVTTVLPDGVNIFDFREGVVIVHHMSVIPVIVLLRNHLSDVARTRNINVDISEKKQILYNYLTSVEFRQKVEAVVEAFGYMMEDLQKEKRSITKNWMKREKQIEKAFLSLASMYGGLQGIIGSSLPELKGLNLPELDEGNSDEF